MAQLLITGGAGFIGSHTALVLLEAGHSLVVLDNFLNSSPESLRRVAELAGLRGDQRRLVIIHGDIRDTNALNKAFGRKKIDGVIHFAGLKAVGESVCQPLLYWDNNVRGSLTLLEAMSHFECKTIVFSSTSTVYGEPEIFPIRENFPLSPLHPYAQSKLATEQILNSLSKTEEDWTVSCLRYFNPVGAHPSGRIGEDPSGIPNNLFPYITQVACGRRKELCIFGNDYPTPDGTGIRDYLHVMDLAEAHKTAIESLLKSSASLPPMNLGTGKGLSVLEVVEGFQQSTGLTIPIRFCPRRSGDVAKLEASAALAKRKLGWQANRSLNDMCTDGWAWQNANPQGYSSNQPS